MASPKKSPSAGVARARRASEPQALPTRRHAEVPFVGRVREKSRLAVALASDTFPQALLLIGAPGTGKQRLAEWVAQALLCARPRVGQPCGVCPSCRQVRDLAHPDLHLFAPHGSLGGGTPEVQLATVDEIRVAQAEARRADALASGLAPEDAYYLATIRSLKREAVRRPVAGARKVFLLADVDRLSGRDGGTSEAANALLKVLEEPPEGTHFLLTSSAPHRIPTTIRSRTTEICLTPLPEAEIHCVLMEAIPDTLGREEELTRAAQHAAGSVLRARQWLSPGWQKIRGRAVELVTLALSGDALSRYAVVKAQGAWALKEEGAKAGEGTFAELLLQVEDLLLEAGRYVSREADFSVPITPALETHLKSLGSTSLPGAGQWAEAAIATAAALSECRANVNPKLVLHTLLVRMEQALAPR